MNIKKVNNVLKLDNKSKFEYFIRKITDFEEVWGLYDDGWAVLECDNIKSIPFWPEKEFAQINTKNIWNSYKPKSINIYNFIEKWLPGMSSDKFYVCIFYTSQDKGIIVSPIELKEKIKIELEQYN